MRKMAKSHPTVVAWYLWFWDIPNVCGCLSMNNTKIHIKLFPNCGAVEYAFNQHNSEDKLSMLILVPITLKDWLFLKLIWNHYKVWNDIHASTLTFFVCGCHFLALAIRKLMKIDERWCADMMARCKLTCQLIYPNPPKGFV